MFEVCESRYDELLKYAYTITRRKVFAEDAVQGALVKAICKSGQLRNADSTYFWVLKIVRNEALSIFKYYQNLSVTDADLGVDMEDGMNIPEHAFDVKERAKLVGDMVKKLDYKSRLILKLRVWGDKRFDGIAGEVGMQTSSVHSSYSRAIHKLRKLCANIYDK